MESVVSKWVIPGIITVLVGTAIAVLFGQANVQSDLNERANAIIFNAGDQGAADWAQISFDGRDGILSGTSTDPDSVKPLIAQLAALHGVRSITSDVVIAPSASPYPFSATLENGEITLTGGVPSLRVRDELLAETGAKDGGLELASGVPAGDWKSVALFAVSRLETLVQGEAKLADMDLNVTGVAKTPVSYVEAISALGGDLPDGILLITASIEPALVEDFSFSANRSNGITTVKGYVPDRLVRQSIGALSGASTVPLLEARGAPEGFAASVQYGLELLNTMSEGNMEISAAGLSVSGTAASQLDYATAIALVAASPADGLAISGISLIPATQEYYFWSTQKRADGSLTLRGYAPDEATRTALLVRAGSTAIDKMQIANGAPATFYEDALVSISALKNLETGQAGFRGNSWYLRGNPALQENANAAEQALITARTPASKWRVDLAAPLEVEVVAQSEPEPASSVEAAVAPVIFSAKIGDGGVLLLGQVPDRDARNILGLSAGGASTSALSENPANLPDNFLTSARTGISALRKLSEGSLSYGAGGWTLLGVVPTPEALGAIAGDLAASGINWNSKLTLPSQEVICQNRIPQFGGAAAIQFKSGTTQVAAGSMAIIERLAGFMNQCDALQLRVEGHTDNQGDFAANLQISSDQADAVIAVLAAQGVDQNRMFSVGFGDTAPIASNDSAEGRAANRRIVFNIVQ